jgi:hypothetical protein
MVGHRKKLDATGNSECAASAMRIAHYWVTAPHFNKK